jgi:hypothetical protein
MLNRKFFAVPLGIAALGFAVTGASAATVVGSPSESNNQSSSTSQGGAQSAGGGVVVGSVDQHAANVSSNDLTNVQVVGGGSHSVLVAGSCNCSGGPSLTNNQGVATSQSISQNAGGGGGTVVGHVDQSAFNGSFNTLTNVQKVGTGGGVLVGSPTLSNNQSVSTSQGILQDPDCGVIVGDVHQHAANVSANHLTSVQVVGGGRSRGRRGGDTTLVGSPSATNAQGVATSQSISQLAGSGVTVGHVHQSLANRSHNTQTNINIIV